MVNVVFRVDSSREIGMGHVSRCLSLARAMREKSAFIQFICVNHPGSAIQYISQEGFQVHRLDVNASFKPVEQYDSWVGDSEINDLAKTMSCLKDIKCDLLVVDHYGLGEEWESKIKGVASRVMVIDDFLSRKHKCDYLLNPNGLDQKKKSNRLSMIGPKYALLRKEFNRHRHDAASRVENLTEVTSAFVCFGGVDPTDLTRKVVNDLLSMDVLSEIHVVVSNAYRWTKELSSISSSKLSVYVSPDHVSQIMLRCDIAIGASGGMSWERCSMGLPSFIINFAENQSDIAEYLSTLGLASVGRLNNNLYENLQTWIRFCQTNIDKTKVVSNKAMALVDGLGAQRVCEELGKSYEGMPAYTA